MKFYESTILLASASPRRASILQNAGCKFKVLDNLNVDETIDGDVKPNDFALHVALKKMKVAKTFASTNTFVLCADTTVIYNNQVFNKPTSQSQAKEMLHCLSGNIHKVITAVCIYKEGREESFTEITEVTFRNLTDETIEYFLSHYELMDKAGAYGIQDGIGLYAVTNINGCFYNVMGLPISKVIRTIENW